MSVQLSLQNINKSYAGKTLFKDLSFNIAEGEKVALMGANAAGKSTLLKIAAKIIDPDAGQVVSVTNGNIVSISQSESYDKNSSLEEVILEDLKAYVNDDTTLYNKLNKALSLLEGLDENEIIKNLNGGALKKLAITLALLREPTLLLADEPTNHLDIESIIWLENILKKANFAAIIVSHDRYFLKESVDCFMEINPVFEKGYHKFTLKFEAYLIAREELFEGLMQKQSKLKNQLKIETEWLSKNPRARSTKAVYRINAAKKLSQDYSSVKSRNSQHKSIELELGSKSSRSKKYIEVVNVTYKVSDKLNLSELNLTMGPSDIVGVIGKNASGKSTLLKLLAGNLKPTTGKIKQLNDLRVNYFEQNLESLDENLTLKQALCPDGDRVDYQGKSIHINSFCQLFLFASSELTTIVKNLSGGQKARILLANFMLNQADMLLLDEPTNNLDSQTKQVFESRLKEFKGAIAIISHDRELLSNICTQFVTIDGGNVTITSSLDQALQYMGSVKSKNLNKAKGKANAKQKPLFSYHLKKELEGMENSIAKQEALIDKLGKQLESPDVVSDAVKLAEFCRDLEQEQTSLNKLYDRWQELESLKAQA